MSKARRGQIVIIKEILDAASGEGVTKTAIVYKIGFNFGRVEKYIDFMLRRELLEQVSSRPFSVYRATARGQVAFRMLSEAEAYIFGSPRNSEEENERIFAYAE